MLAGILPLILENHWRSLGIDIIWPKIVFKLLWTWGRGFFRLNPSISFCCLHFYSPTTLMKDKWVSYEKVSWENWVTETAYVNSKLKLELVSIEGLSEDHGKCIWQSYALTVSRTQIFRHFFHECLEMHSISNDSVIVHHLSLFWFTIKRKYFWWLCL